VAAKAREQETDHGTLTRVSGPETGTFIRLTGTTVVGRAPDCDVRVEDESVSRRHARIVGDGEQGYVLQDLGSCNGTTIEGEPITRRRLANGDTIAMGDALFRFGLPGADRIEGENDADASLDSLTGALHRDRLDDLLSEEVTQAKRNRVDVWLLVLGLDQDDSLRASYGEEACEAALVELAATVSTALRGDDVFARYGEGELAIMSRDPLRRDPLRLAERLRALVEEKPFLRGESLVLLSVSIGVATLADCEEPSADQLTRIAEAGLSAARLAGGNRCRRFARY
jgi:diguanylate cyclase (GGDEF)-like protein